MYLILIDYTDDVFKANNVVQMIFCKWDLLTNPRKQEQTWKKGKVT